MRFFAFLVLAAFPAAAQQQLSLREAVRLALAQNKSIAASQADLNAASAKVQEARAGLLPKVNYSESLTRSNNPVFVFSSLLAQHQFTQSNFNIYALNRPGFLDNFQSAVSADQVLFDAGQTRKATRSAELNRRIVSEDDRQVRSQLTLLVVKSYLDVVLGQQAVDAAEQAVKSAQADLERAENVRRAGRSTDADVLSIRVHLARMREQTIRNDAALKTAQAALNDVLGEPIDTPYTLTSAPTPLQPIGRRTGELERDAAMKRPEAQRANLAMQVASTQVGLAQSSFWPKLTAHAVFESDRQQFANRGGANWLGSVSLNWNLFNGGADKARLEEARASLLRSRAERDRLSSSLKVEVRRAANDLEAANQQVEVARNTVDEAEESLRITQNRYQVGMSTVTDLLRTEAAVLESRTQYQAALHDQRLAAAMLEFAAGQLSVDSPVVNE